MLCSYVKPWKRWFYTTRLTLRNRATRAERQICSDIVPRPLGTSPLNCNGFDAGHRQHLSAITVLFPSR